MGSGLYTQTGGKGSGHFSDFEPTELVTFDYKGRGYWLEKFEIARGLADEALGLGTCA
jgi:hypothetical protein